MKKNCTLFVATKMQDLLFIMHIVLKCMYDYKLIKCVIISRARIVYVFQRSVSQLLCSCDIDIHVDFFYVFDTCTI